MQDIAVIVHIDETSNFSVAAKENDYTKYLRITLDRTEVYLDLDIAKALHGQMGRAIKDAENTVTEQPSASNKGRYVIQKWCEYGNGHKSWDRAGQEIDYYAEALRAVNVIRALYPNSQYRIMNLDTGHAVG